MTSYKLSESYNFQCLLWDVAGAIVGGVRLIIAIDRQTAVWRNRQTQRLYADVAVIAPALGAVLVALLGLLVAFGGYALPIVGRWALRAAPWALCIAVGAGVAALCIAYPVLLLGAGVIALFGYATFPKGA